MILPAVPGCRTPSTILAASLAVWGLTGPLFFPRAAFSILIAAAGILPGFPRLWSDFAAPNTFLVLTVSTAGSLLAGSLWRGEPARIDRRVLTWGGAFVAVALASAVASGIRGYSLFFLLRGGVEPHVVNSLGMLAWDRFIEAAHLFLVFASLLPLLDSGIRLVREDQAFVRRTVVAACLLAGVGGIFGKAVPSEAGSYWLIAERVGGLMTDPNALGIGLSLLVPVVAAGLLPGKTAMRVAAAISLVCAAWALEVSGSRSGLLLLLVAGVVAGIAAYRRGGQVRRFTVWAGLGIAAVLTAVILLSPRSEKIAAGGLLTRLGAGVREKSLERIANSRSLYWSAAWDTIRREPVSGCGLAGFPYEFPFWFESRFGPARFTDNTTNGFLDIAAECGLPALILVLLATWPVLLRAARVVWREERQAPETIAGAATLAGFAVILLWGSHVRNPEVAVWMLVPVLYVMAPGPQDGENAESAGPRGRLLWILTASGILGAVLSLHQTLSPAWAFRTQPWAGLHGGGTEALTDGVPHWSGPVLYRRVVAGERSVRFAFRNLRPDGRSVVAEIDVDGVRAGAISLEAGEERWFRLEPVAPGSEAIRVRFEPTFVPRKLTGGPDARELGVMVLPVSGRGLR